jgi:hypothetical protein
MFESHLLRRNNLDISFAHFGLDAKEHKRNNTDATIRSSSSPESSPKEVDRGKPKGKNSFGKNSLGKYSESSTSIPHTILPKTREVYHIVNQMTGSLGGNCHGGAIYGELTIGSMQKMIELMKVHTGGPDSRFIDVGSGLGKPNLHVTQDPSVEFSYGIEMEHVRWALGMANLNKVLEAGQKQKTCNVEESDRIGHTPLQGPRRSLRREED